MTDPTQLPRVEVRGARLSNDVTLVVRGRAWGGWTEVRITRGIERLPSDFEVRLTERFPGEAQALALNPGDTCVVKIGADPVVTGYIDRVLMSVDSRRHEVIIAGRSMCQDLVDCAAEWPGGQIVGASVLEIARKLAAPVGVTVNSIGDIGGAIQTFNLMRGETPWEIIERLCRFRALLAYDMPDGSLMLTRASTARAGSGFQEGVNVLAAQVLLSVDQQFSEYRCYMQSVELLKELGTGGDLIATFKNAGIKRHRLRIIVAEASSLGVELAKDRAMWEANRRWGRSAQVRLTTDSWRDVNGKLYAPNTLARVQLPALKVPDALWTIGEVTYRSGAGGTLCDLTLMAPEAFLPQPQILFAVPLQELGRLPDNLGRP